MIVKVYDKLGGLIYRNVSTYKDVRKIAKNIHKYFPDSKYSYLEGVIWNAYKKEQSVLVLNEPEKQDETQLCK